MISADASIPIRHIIYQRRQWYNDWGRGRAVGRSGSFVLFLSTHPSDPRALILSKRDLPGGFERLKEFIWLKEGPDGEGVQQTKRDEEEEDIGGGRR